MQDDVTREKLFAAAIEAFLSRGYGAANLDEIAGVAGISKKTIYEYAASKSELFIEVIRDVISNLPQHPLEPINELNEPAEALKDFLRPIAALALSFDGLRFYRMMMREAPMFPDMVAAYLKAGSSYAQGLVTWLSKQADRGWLAPVPPSDAARSIMTLLLAETRRNFLIDETAVPEKADIEVLIEDAVDAFLNGSRTKRTG